MEEKDAGFGLVELLVVIVIIGILASISLPMYFSQRDKAYLVSLQTDVRHMAVAIEGWSSKPGRAMSQLDNADQNSSELRTEGWHSNEDVALKVVVIGADYCINGVHSHVAGTEVRYRRSVGRIEVGQAGTLNC